MKLKFKDVLPNPWRDLKGNPLKPEKIEELVASINTTGFWDNVLTRKNKAGKYELAYGHHRVQAAIEAGLESADFIVKDLDDDLMIKIMDNENREVYGSSPASMIESVKAVITALAEGAIKPFFTEASGPEVRNFRYAPSYVSSSMGREEHGEIEKAYTALAVAQFLGRTVKAGKLDAERPAQAIESALDYLCLQELGKINKAVLVKDNRPISTLQLKTITDAVKQRHVAEVVKRGKCAAEQAKAMADLKAAQDKQKADEKEADDKRKALLKAAADARREENYKKQEALDAKRKSEDERAKAKEALNKERVKQFEEQLEAKKKWEAEQQVQDAYKSIRRDVETLITRWETKVSERDAEREQVKALAKLRALRPEDRLRLRKAALEVSDHYSAWVAAQFAPLPTAKAELKEMKKREISKRKNEKETK